MHLNAIGLICGDLERSLLFYRMLGVPLDDFDPETGHYEGDLGGGVKLMLDSEAVMASFIEGFTTPTGNDRISLAVECQTPKDVDETFALVTGQGFEGVREPFDAFWGQRYAFWGQRYATVADPDGNDVDIYAAL